MKKVIFAMFAVIMFAASCKKDVPVPTPEPPTPVAVSWVAISNPVDYTRGGFEFAATVKLDQRITTDALVTLQWDNFDTNTHQTIATGLQYTFKIPANWIDNQPYTQTGIKALIGSVATNVKITKATSTGNYKFNF